MDIDRAKHHTQSHHGLGNILVYFQMVDTAEIQLLKAYSQLLPKTTGVQLKGTPSPGLMKHGPPRAGCLPLIIRPDRFDMKVTFLLRPDGGLFFGGAEVQAIQTAAALRRLGVQVDVLNAESTEVGDLVHAFGPYAAHLSTMEYCKARGIPFVFSTIFYKDVNYDFQLCRERLRALRKHTPPWVFKKLVQGAHAILPNTHAEARQVGAICDTDPDKVFVVPNGAEQRFNSGDAGAFREKFRISEPFVLNVARIEKRKNQLRLIEATRELGLKLVLIGKEDMGKYSQACRKLAASNNHVSFIPPIPHEDPMLANAYAACKVFALPSRLETPGIAALEAGLAGARVVTTPVGGGKEYFEDMARYVKSNSVSDIKEKLTDAWNDPDTSMRLQRHIQDNFTWDAVAAKTIAVYRKILAGKG